MFSLPIAVVCYEQEEVAIKREAVKNKIDWC